MRKNAYGIGEAHAAVVAARAFDQTKPPVPEIRLEWVRKIDPTDEPRYRKAWKEGIEEIYAEIRDSAGQAVSDLARPKAL
ncbi:MAG: hypothetical protein ABFS45_23180 [Pseudomonadota bacterium]